MKKGIHTEVKTRFRTRYHLTLVDPETGEDVGETTTVDNLVLLSGYLALGDVTAFSTLSIGTNTTPASVNQLGILTPIATMPIEDGVFSQLIQSDSEDIAPGNIVTSTIAYEFTFKDIIFPSNQKSLFVSEIGLDRLTRAVMEEPIEITRSTWLRVVAEIIYVYEFSIGDISIPYSIYGETSTNGTLNVTVSPFIYNQNPANNTGRGWGANRAVLCYPWGGAENDFSDRGLATSLGMTIVSQLVKQEYMWKWDVTFTAKLDTILHGFVVRDTVNGGAYLIRFQNIYSNDFTLPEDATIKLSIKFKWAGGTED